MTGGLWRVGVGIALAVACLTGPTCGRALAADVDDLPHTVRLMLQCVEVDWSQLQVTSPEQVTLGRTPPAAPTATENTAPPVALSRKPIALGGVGAGAAPAAGASHPAAEEARVQLGTADLMPDVVAGGALSAARRNALVALAGAGGLSAEEWKDRILQEKLTFEDMCAVWAQFRREYPQEGESPERTRPVWHGTRDALGLADVDTSTLPIPQLFVLAEMQLYPGETQGAGKCLKEILTRLETGEPAGPRVTKGLIAYRIAQCYRHRGESQSAVEWFMNCAEWGAPTRENAYDVRGEGLVEAARLLRQMGRAEEAEAAYRKAISSTAGWGKAVAMLDLSAVLQGKGSAAEADAMLTELARGSCGAVAQGHALLTLARGRFEAGDAQGTRECLSRLLLGTAAPQCRQTVTETSALADTAASMLADIDGWHREPVRVYPSTVLLTGSRPSVEVVIRWWRLPPSVHCGATWLAAEPLGEPEAREGVTHQRYRVSARGDHPEGTAKAHIIVGTGTDADSAPLRVAVTAIRDVSVVLAPQEFFFGFVRQGERARREVVVRLPDGFAVTDVLSGSDAITVSDPERTIDGWRIAAVALPTAAGVLSTTVTVVTNMPDRARVAVPVYAHVSAD